MIDLKSEFQQALAADPYQDALAQLAADRFGRKIPAAKRAELTSTALQIGVELAEKLLQEYSSEKKAADDSAAKTDSKKQPDDNPEISHETEAAAGGSRPSRQRLQDPGVLAVRLGAVVTDSEYPIAPEFTTVGYFETPNEIFVNRYFARYDEQAEAAGMPLLRYVSWREVVIAHELFHYLDETKKAVPQQDYRLKLWQLGPYTHQTELSVLREISAMAFAQKLTDWPFYPGRLSAMLVKLTRNDVASP